MPFAGLYLRNSSLIKAEDSSDIVLKHAIFQHHVNGNSVLKIRRAPTVLSHVLSLSFEGVHGA